MKKVLIIEDDQYLTDLIAELLKTDNIECVAANSADAVLHDWGTLDIYRVIILDIMMMRDGLEEADSERDLETGEILYKRIRAGFPKKQIVIMSAKDIESMTIDFRKEPHVSILPKPLGEKEFLDLLTIIRST